MYDPLLDHSGVVPTDFEYIVYFTSLSHVDCRLDVEVGFMIRSPRDTQILQTSNAWKENGTYDVRSALVTDKT